MGSMFLLGIFYLINVIFDLYTIVLIVRLVLAWVGADSSHPFIQLIIKITSPVVKPLKSFLPDVKDIELSTLVLIILLQSIKWFLISILTPGFGIPNIIGVLISGIASSLSLAITVFFYAFLALFILSFIQQNSPFYRQLLKFCRPVLAPIQKVVPPISGIDLSPAIACIILQFIKIVLVDSLLSWGQGIAFIGFR
jgi:YggT family protein